MNKAFRAKFPKFNNRERFSKNREFKYKNREFENRNLLADEVFGNTQGSYRIYAR